MVQTEHAAQHAHRCGRHVDDGDGVGHRFIVAGLRGHHPAHRLQYHVDAGQLRQRTAFAIGRQRDGDDALLERIQLLEVDAQLARHARPQRVDHHVADLHHLVEGIAAFRILKIHRQAAHAAVVGEAGGAERIAGQRLNLENVGAKLRQQQAAVRTRNERAHVENPETVQRARTQRRRLVGTRRRRTDRDLAGVGTELRRRTTHLAGSLGQVDRHARHGDGTALGVLHLRTHADRLHLRVIQPLFRGAERAAGNAEAADHVQQIVAIVLEKFLRDLVLCPIDVGRKNEVLDLAVHARVFQHIAEAQGIG